MQSNVQRKVWMGQVPSHCQLTNKPITDTFIDGATRYGPWAIMHPDAHAVNGKGLGTGKGQRYERDASDGKWYKVEG